MTKNNKGLIITIIVLLCIVVIMLAGLMAYLLTINSGINFAGFENKDKIIYDESFDSSNVNNLIINSDCGDIDIKQSTDGEIRIVARGGKADKFSLNNTEGTITVNSKKDKAYNTFSFYKLQNITQDIEIYLPDDCIEMLEINSSYGDVDIDSSINSQLKISCDYGDIQASRLYGTVTIQTDCGNIDIKEINITSNSSIITDLGDIDIGRTNDIRIDYETSLGDCDIKNNNTQSDIILTVKTDLGDIEIND